MLNAPEVEVFSITPFSSRIAWSKINNPVDEWLVMLKRNDLNEADQVDLDLITSQISVR